MACLGPCPSGKEGEKVTCPNRKSICPGQPEGVFFEPCNHNKFFEDFWNTQHQNLNKLANFFKFQSTSIHAILSDRRQETVSVPTNSL